LQEGGGQRKRIIKEFKNLVNLRAGGDTVGICRALLKSAGFGDFEDDKFSSLLNILKDLHQKAQNHQKAQWVSIPRKAGFKRKFLVERCF
jgi:hypothetical protein